MRNKKITLFLFLALALNGYAKEGIRISFKNDNQPLELQYASISKITFEGDNLCAQTVSGETQTIAMDNIRMISFVTDIETSVDKVNLSEDVVLRCRNNVIEVTNPNRKDLSIGIFDVKGALTKVVRTSAEQTEIDFTSYQAGIYVIKANSTVFKLVKQ